MCFLCTIKKGIFSVFAVIKKGTSQILKCQLCQPLKKGIIQEDYRKINFHTPSPLFYYALMLLCDSGHGFFSLVYFMKIPEYQDPLGMYGYTTTPPLPLYIYYRERVYII